MKHIKKFEDIGQDNESIELIGYPEGNIIEVSNGELDILEDEFEIRWDDEPDYEEGVTGQWRFLNEEEDDIEGWLEVFRATSSPKLYKDLKKYNL